MNKYRVLLVEDEAGARIMLARAIAKEGFEVLEAEDGEAAIEIFKKEKPEIVITDLKLPKVTGLEVLHAVKHIRPDAQVIMNTAFGEGDVAIQALQYGALDYFKKPVDLDELFTALGRAKEIVDKLDANHPTPNVLIAEDEEKARTSLVRVLKGEDWTVYQATNGQEAIDIFQKNKIDIVLLDIKMPKLTGLQALTEMREYSEDFEAIILTGFGDEDSAIEAMRSGALNFLKKPVDLDQLILSVEKAYEKLKLARSLKYRVRELELKNSIIATISPDKEIIFESDTTNDTLNGFVQDMLDSIPLGLVAIDKDLNIKYANGSIRGAFESFPKKVTADFISGLEKFGIKGLDLGVLKEYLGKALQQESKGHTLLKVGEWSNIMCTAAKFINKKEMETNLLLILRGE